MLLCNELFTLSLTATIGNKSEDEASKYVEQSCINKLERIMAMEKQKNICEGIESRLGRLIDRKIEALTQFS